MKAGFGYALIAAAAFAVAGCQDDDTPSEPTAEQIANQTPLAPENRPIDLLADGVVIQPSEVGGSPTAIDFGMPEDAVVGALTEVFGGPQYGSNEECGAGPMTFASFGSFVANFRNDRFAGWMVNEASERADFSGPGGVTIGMPADEVRALEGYFALEDSTLGEEFMLGAGEMQVSGLIEDGAVAALWGGTACNFR